MGFVFVAPFICLNEDLFICGKRTRRFKRHWTIKTQSADSIYYAISNYTLHEHMLSCPKMVFLDGNEKFCFLVSWFRGFECGCPFARVSSYCQCCQCNIETAFFSSLDFKTAGFFMNRISFHQQPASIDR